SPIWPSFYRNCMPLQADGTVHSCSLLTQSCWESRRSSPCARPTSRTGLRFAVARKKPHTDKVRLSLLHPSLTQPLSKNHRYVAPRYSFIRQRPLAAGETRSRLRFLEITPRTPEEYIPPIPLDVHNVPEASPGY